MSIFEKQVIRILGLDSVKQSEKNMQLFIK